MNIYLSPSLKQIVESKTAGKTQLKYLIFCSSLFLASVQRKRALDQFVPLSAKIGQKLFHPTVYKPMVADLKLWGAIEVDDSYQVMVTCKGFRLAEPYRNDIRPFKVEYPSMEQKLAKVRSRDIRSDLDRWIIQNYLSTSFGPEAWQILKTAVYRSETQRSAHEYCFETVDSRLVSFSRDTKTGRIFYPITQLPKSLRHNLLMAGEPLVELDVAAAQPFLAATLYPNECPEKQAYLSLVTSGRFYEEINGWMDQRWPLEMLKIEVLKGIFYGCPFKEYPINAIFAQRFPILSEQIREAKGTSNNAFPIRLQKLEADIMIGKVLPDCMARGIKVLPVHDALLCRPTDAAAAQAIMARHWLDVTGNAPFIRTRMPQTALAA